MHMLCASTNLSMSSKLSKILTKIATFLNGTCGKITVDPFGIPIRANNSTSVKGLYSIIVTLIKETNNDELLGKTATEQAQVYQFIEYANVYVMGCSSQQIMSEILPHLRALLARKTYLCGTRITIADVLIYYLLHDTLAEISHLDQGKFVNVFRWMDNLQEDKHLRQKNSLILFNTKVICASDISKCEYPYNL